MHILSLIYASYAEKSCFLWMKDLLLTGERLTSYE